MDDIKIYTEDDVARARGRGEEKLKDLSTEQVIALKNKIKNNLFVLAYGVLGFDKLHPVLHKDYCAWFDRTREKQFRLSLLPRSHFKSTINTIADTIQIFLPDELGTAPYPRNIGYDVRILIAHEIDGKAQEFLSAIRDFVFRNEILLALYKDIVPQKGRADNKSNLELNRTRIWPEATVTSMGVGGKRQGSHFDYIKGDDLQGDSATYSPSELISTKRWIDNLQSFLLTPASDHIDFAGTRWAYDDAWAHVMKNYEENLEIYHRAVEEYDKEQKKKVPIFPARYHYKNDPNSKLYDEDFGDPKLSVHSGFNEKSLNILRKNRAVFNAQYLNNPGEGASTFEESYLRYWHWFSDRKVAVKDNVGEIDIYDISALDKIILIDPAMTGNFGYCVTGTTPKGQHIVLKSVKREFKQPEFVDFLFSDVTRWKPRIVVIESVLFSELYQYWFVREMSARRTRFRIEPVSTRQKSKAARITGLSNYFAAGQIFFHQEQHDILQEFREFGASDNIHILDALAYGPEFWKTPPALRVIDGNNQALAVASGGRLRDLNTGYSSYLEDLEE